MQPTASPALRFSLIVMLSAFGICLPEPALMAATFTAEADDLAANRIAMRTMMANMAIKPTGNVDLDFVAMMVPHHQGAVDMSEAELRYGHNQQLIRIAQGIIVQEMQEIAAMRLAVGEPAATTWVVEPQTDGHAPVDSLNAEAAYLWQNNAAMNTMVMNMALQPCGDVDRDFAAMMIPHHQGGIAMAQAELRYGHNPQLARIAQEIIVDQQQDVVVMRLAVGEALPVSGAAQDQAGAFVAQDNPRSSTRK